MKRDRGSLEGHPVVSREAWLSARTALLAKEKEFTRLRDDLSRQRRELPWVKVDKAYVFDGPSGKEPLAALFASRSQLVVYHFMFNPAWDEGCRHCSFWADNFNPIGVHLNHRDVTLVAISRAPLAKIESFKKLMGWSFKWVSSSQNDYNYARTRMDFADREGVSVFYKDRGGTVFHTYSCYARGIDLLNTAYNYLDLVPKGRDEDGLEFTQSWVRHHDRYED